MHDFPGPSKNSAIGNQAGDCLKTRQNGDPLDISGETCRHSTCANRIMPTGRLGANPQLFSVLPSQPQNQASLILVETEILLRMYGHRKIRVADIADACAFSAANVYRYFPSRRAILNALASHYLSEAELTAVACATRNSNSAQDRLSGFLLGLNTTLIITSDSEPQISELLADAATEQWPCYSHYSARVILRIANFLTEASVSGDLALEADLEQEAKRVKAGACALVEPDVIRLCRDKHDANTREGLSRLIAAALFSVSASPA
ncbi:TetR/AcrR family transcriptional regulator [Bradyrhizobium sp. INPA01-394B]|uniref:TetR/AcrR family transcriptional regulator n=1 Tax=Bradyrhizobium campsiandrae TaxID=1729892 RepID=A0ABR7U3H1_9BRAD|nr:TetR/AcrR family transcriptional regulator [Bradyrhizobium campsiandrae]MBC9879877.1 TetR/AcrR family transcriptional regulator [Bradyrhizobium campsiandrae]MBC9978562.1 TetR/AcrR family transcriptional regulator [Bradyrhizobium campsiandrae]